MKQAVAEATAVSPNAANDRKLNSTAPGVVQQSPRLFSGRVVVKDDDLVDVEPRPLAPPTTSDIPTVTNRPSTSTTLAPRVTDPIPAREASATIEIAQNARPSFSKPKAKSESEDYVDRVIDPSVLTEDPFTELARQNAQRTRREGRRFTSIESTQFYRSGSNRDGYYEHGVGIIAEFETLNYGNISLDSAARYSPDIVSSEDTYGERFTLRADAVPALRGWNADLVLGDTRGTVDPLLSSSYRYALPSSVMRGAEGKLYSDQTELRFAFGRVGGRRGFTEQTFDAESGRLVGAGLTRVLSRGWSVSGQAWALRDDLDIEDHESFASVVQWQNPRRLQSFQLHSLFDSNGKTGVWMDLEARVRSWRHRAGAFRFGPDVLWTDVRVSSDRHGAYWRADQNRYRRSLSFGLDWKETNISDDPTRLGTNDLAGFGGIRWHWSRTLSVGASVRAQLGRQGFCAPCDRPNVPIRDQVDEFDFVRLAGFLNRDSRVGATTLQVELSDRQSDLSPENRIAVTWDQEWTRALRWDRLSTTLAFELIDTELDTENIGRAGLSYQRSVTPNFVIRGDADYVSSSTDLSGEATTTSFDFGIRWRGYRFWDVDFAFSWVDTAQETFSGLELDRDESRVLLSIRRSEDIGTPLVVEGGDRGERGAGSLTGVVFLDTNRDGRRSAGENGVPGIAVYLDGRFTRYTDDDGRYHFGAVHAGEHRLSIGIEDIPLPWGLEDERPQRVLVQARAESEFDFALGRLDEWFAALPEESLLHTDSD